MRVSKLDTYVFAVIRKDTLEGYEWIDLHTVTNRKRTSLQALKDHDSVKQKAWKDNNPKVRVGKFEMREVKG